MTLQNNDTVHVVFATDDRYAPFLGVTLQSLIEHINKSRNYCIYILINEILQSNVVKIHRIVDNFPNINIKFIFIKEKIATFNSFYFHQSSLTIAAYYRLLLPSFIPECKKVVYLDCDLIIQSDIANLFDIDIGKNYIGACPDLGVTYINSEWIKDIVANMPNRGLFPNEYINSGVLLINLDIMRLEHVEDKLIAIAQQRDLIWQDQDVFNIVCKGRIVYLKSGWNYVMHCYREKELLNMSCCLEKTSIFIIHFARPGYKPWENIESEYVNLWWFYARKSPFFEGILNYSKGKFSLSFFIVAFLMYLVIPFPSLKCRFRNRFLNEKKRLKLRNYLKNNYADK